MLNLMYILYLINNKFILLYLNTLIDDLKYSNTKVRTYYLLNKEYASNSSFICYSLLLYSNN